MKEEERRRTIRSKLAQMQDRPAAAISTGSPELDRLLGGGWPRGGIAEIFGPPSSGKTTLLLRSAAHAQALGLTAAWIDADHAFDAAYAASLGIHVALMPVAQPASAEEAMEIALRLSLSCAVDLIVVDSAAALVPRLELEAGIGDSSPGLQARVLASGLRKLASALRRTGTAAVFVNHARMSREPGGEEGESSAAGAPLKLHAAVRIALEAGGGGMRFRLRKSRLAGAHGECVLGPRGTPDAPEGP